MVPSSLWPWALGAIPGLCQQHFRGVCETPATVLTPGLRACLEREETWVLPDWSCHRSPFMNGGEGEMCLF